MWLDLNINGIITQFSFVISIVIIAAMLLLMMRFAVVIGIHLTEIPLCETIPCDVIELVMELREQRRCS